MGRKPFLVKNTWSMMIIFMKLFFHNLEGDVRKWFGEIPMASISTWKPLESTFMRKWGEKRYNIYYIPQFFSLKKRANEVVVEFNRRFNKIYKKIPRDIKPSQLVEKVTYVGAFVVDFSMVLRERRSPNFLIMQDDAIEIEGNMIAYGKMK
jgi:hypothetical protein